MRIINHSLKPLLVLTLTLLLTACEKPPGPGGKAVVKGKVYARDYDNTQQYLLSKGYSAGETVYICYGNSTMVGNNVKTSSDGSFQFNYLTKGHYKIFVNSLDTSIKVKGNDTEIPVAVEFDIKDGRETKTLDDIIINK